MNKVALALSLLLPVLTFATRADAQMDTSHQRAVYKEINAHLKSFQKVSGKLKGPNGVIILTGWVEDGAVRKIVAKPGNAGTGVDEFYLENGRPLYVFANRKNDQTGRRVEERLSFADGHIAEWLTTDKSYAPHGEDYDGLTEKLNADCAAFVAVLQPEPTAKAAAADLKTTTGTFTGIEPGDYAHWNMRTAAGEDVSYFVLRPDASVERMLDDASKYAGRKCRVSWKTTTENLPEAGGKTRINQVVHVDWLAAD